MSGSEAQILWLFFVGLFVFFRIYTLFWVAKDISRRTNHLGTQVLCVFVIVFMTPVVGLPVYFLLRPITRKDVLREQEEISELLHAQTVNCSSCGGANVHEHMFCVFCGKKLKQPCRVCKKSVAIGYLYCPFCATQMSDPEQSSERASDPLF